MSEIYEWVGGIPRIQYINALGVRILKAMAKLLSSCSTVSLGHVLKGPRASNEISTAEPSEAVASREGMGRTKWQLARYKCIDTSKQIRHM